MKEMVSLAEAMPAAESWRADVAVYPTGEKRLLVQSRSTGATCLLHAVYVELLVQCCEFKTLDEHMAAFCRGKEMGGTSMNAEVVEGLRHKLQQLARDGYLVTHGQLHSLFESADASASHRAYDIEADWILMSTCNFRCVYCFWDAKALGRKIAPLASVQKLATFFDETDLTWLLHLTGGEPFHYPQFVELCRLLTRRHFISINTNADSHHIGNFAETIDPKRVDFINCGVHIQQRQERKRTEAFISNVQTLRARGFDVFVSCVMYPPVFAEFSDAWEWYAEQGVVLIPKVFQGEYLGASYPESYTDAERAIFIEYSDRASEAYADQFARRAEPPTINPFLDKSHFLTGLGDFRGQYCDAGHRFVRIYENGDIWRCGAGDVLGNIVEGRFERRAQPSICREIECPYFCKKYMIH